MRVPTKWALLIIGVITAAAIWAGQDGGDDKAAVKSDTPIADSEGSTSSTEVKLNARGSWCVPDPLNAKVYFFVTLRNPDLSSDDVDLRPWRRYSDNSTNDSIIDIQTASLSGKRIEKFRFDLGYNAEDHAVLECGVYMPDKLEPTKIRVVA
jgi:hypothetical protein